MPRAFNYGEARITEKIAGTRVLGGVVSQALITLTGIMKRGGGVSFFYIKRQGLKWKWIFSLGNLLMGTLMGLHSSAVAGLLAIGFYYAIAV